MDGYDLHATSFKGILATAWYHSILLRLSHLVTDDVIKSRWSLNSFACEPNILFNIMSTVSWTYQFLVFSHA